MPDLRRAVTLTRLDKPREVYTDDRTVAITETQDEGKTIQISFASEVTLSLSDNVTNKGYLYLKNWDDTNIIRIGFATGVYPIHLYPGDVNLISLDQTINTMYARSLVAACELQYQLYGR